MLYSSRPVGCEMNSNGTAVAGLEKFSKVAPYCEFKMCSRSSPPQRQVDTPGPNIFPCDFGGIHRWPATIPRAF